MDVTVSESVKMELSINERFNFRLIKRILLEFKYHVGNHTVAAKNLTQTIEQRLNVSCAKTDANKVKQSKMTEVFTISI